ncbi:nucleolar complex protein 14 [Microbotryomycetes sp. JL201]|nr:nucleolar complex protein 14 [Microbotryomycetes sp. JL201]
MAGSQLKQLKQTLRDSGLSRTSTPNDAKKKSHQRKNSAGSLEHRQHKLAQIGQQFNKFDTRDAKNKFEVVTRKGTTEGGKTSLPAKSRQAGLQLRKETLLPMLENRGRTSTFVDRRFGEADTSLTPEEKALQRFTAERQAQFDTSKSRGGKRAKFNIEDDDDNELTGEDGLTHGGRKLGFGDEEELGDSGWGGSLGSGKAPPPPEEDDEPERRKTKAEVMDEIILKSKTAKYERQKMRSADDEARHQLDQELKELRPLLSAAGGAKSTKTNTQGAADEKASSKKSTLDDGSDDEAEPFDESEDANDSDEQSDDSDEDGDEAADGSDGEGSEIELTEEEFKAALAAAKPKSGVDRDLLRKLIGSSSSDEEKEDEPAAAPAPIAKPLEHDGNDGVRPPPAVSGTAVADPYDKFVRMLALEPRGKPSDRLRTPVELAQEAADELKRQEQKRLKRQRGEADDDDSDEDGDGTRARKKGKATQRRAPQGDDLDDDYFEGFDDESGADEGLGRGLESASEKQEMVMLGGESDDEAEAGQVDSDEGSEPEGSEDDEDDGDDDGEDVDLDSEDDSIDDSAPTALVSAVDDDATARSPSKDGHGELPFTFPCPSTHAEFVKLLRTSNIPEDQTATVVKRIRVLYHPGLGESNKEKLQASWPSNPPSPNSSPDEIESRSSIISTSFKTLNSLLPHILTLSHAYPLAIVPYYVEKLSVMQQNFVKAVSRGALDPASQTWPGAPELTFLRLVGMVWSTSDLSHPVAAAAMLLICQYLAQGRIRSSSDVASGLFLCTLASQYETLSKRLVPEAANFLLNVILIMLPTSLNAANLPGSFPAPDFGQEHTKGLKLRLKNTPVSALNPRPVDFTSSLRNGEADVQLKVDLVATVLTLLQDFADKYVSLPAFIELFEPVNEILGKVIVKHLPSFIQEKVSSVRTNLQRMLKLSKSQRQPLYMQHHKPIPIASYVPKFDEGGFNPNKRFDPDSERVEQQKLKALYKKEKKGAVRELRKDNRFLAVEEAKRKKEADEVYQKKIAKIMGSLTEERAEEKAFEKIKAKSKKQDKARSARR